MNEVNNVDIDEAMRRLDERLRSRTPKPRGRKQAFAPYADQFRRYVEQGWSRKELIAEMKALGLSVSAATLRDVLGMSAAKRQPKSARSPFRPRATEVSPAGGGAYGSARPDGGW